MTTDLEADLRREFDAAGRPAGLTFHAETVLRQGSRTVRRRRIIAVGSAAMAVALVATGASLFARPDDKALPLPASSTAAASGTDLPFVAQVSGGPFLTTFLPAQVDEGQLRAAIQEIVDERGLSGPAGIGQVMKEMIARFGSSADGSTINRIAREILAKG